jgi:hypothetical protein
MLKAILATAALVAAATAASAQTAPATPQADHAAHAGHAALPTVNSSIKDLLENPTTAAVLEKHLPGVSQHPARPQFQDMTLEQVVPISGGALTQTIVDAIDADLKALAAH